MLAPSGDHAGSVSSPEPPTSLRLPDPSAPTTKRSAAPGEPLEVLLARVGEGALTPALFELGIGAPVTLDPKPQGFFTFDYVPPHRELWLVATGTGLGPFLSMLRSGAAFARAERVILVHGTRGAADLAHRDELEALVRERSAAFRFVPVLSRQAEAGLLSGRLTAALADGSLDATGTYRWPLAATGDVTVVVDAGLGHRRTVTLAAAELRSATVPAPPTPLPATGSRPTGGGGSSDGSSPLAVRVVVGLTFLLAVAAVGMSFSNRRRLARLEQHWSAHESRG